MSAVIVTGPATLAELVEAAVTRAIGERSEASAPALLDRAGIARALSVSPSTVDRLRREGLPTVLLGDAPRFEVADCVRWLRERGA